MVGFLYSKCFLARIKKKSLLKDKVLTVNGAHRDRVVFELWLSYGCMSGPQGNSVRRAFFTACSVCEDRTVRL